MRIATFGFRHIPLTDECAGADKFALELYTCIAQKGYKVTAYNRVYSNKKNIRKLI